MVEFLALFISVVGAGLTFGGFWLCWDVYKTQQYEGGGAEKPFPLPFFKAYLRRDAAFDLGVAMGVAGYFLGILGGYVAGASQ
ncbi:MAG: hypothetical protein NZ941_04985 [Candidatus Caldarchaeum sp.]|nr:hypothetical protein [Candidatus Caldarchaeum sp.]